MATSVGDPPDRMGNSEQSDAGRLPVALFAWLILFAIWLTWSPFQFRGERSPLQLGLQLDPEAVGHFFFLMPFGVLLAAHARWSWRSLLWVGAIGLVSEAGQGWVAGRSLSVHDLWLGYLGAVLAFGAARRLIRGSVSTTVLSNVIAWATILLAWSINVYGVIHQNHGLQIQGWTAAFPVIAAHEVGGVRVYDGTVEDARLCAGAALHVCVVPGADMAQRRRFARAAMDSQRVAATARVVSATDLQEGPTRIVSFSDGPYLRNLTLAQRKTNLVLRVRMARSGPNGTELEFVLRDAVEAGQSTTVSAEFFAGVATIRSVAAETVREGIYRPPFRTTLRAYGVARPRTPVVLKSHGAQAGVIVAFLGLGLALGYLLPSFPLRLLLAPALALLILAVLDAAVGHTLSPTLGDVAWVALLAAMGAWTNRGALGLRATTG